MREGNCVESCNESKSQTDSIVLWLEGSDLSAWLARLTTLRVLSIFYGLDARISIPSEIG